MPLHRRVKILQTPWLCGPEVVSLAKKKWIVQQGRSDRSSRFGWEISRNILAFCKETLRKPTPLTDTVSLEYPIISFVYPLIIIYIYILFQYLIGNGICQLWNDAYGTRDNSSSSNDPHIAMEKSPFFSIGKSSIDNGLSIP